MAFHSSPGIRHLEQLTAQLLDGVILIDPAGTILSANAAALKMHGVDQLEQLGSTIEEYAARFSLRTGNGRKLKHREYPLFRLLAGERFPDEIIQVAPAGEDEARWIHQVRDVTMDADGGEPDYLALVISDVSARFNAEVRFQAMFNANPAPALVVRLADLRITQANPGFLSLTGFAPEQLTGKGLFELELLSGLPDLPQVRRQIADGQAVTQTEAELLGADGTRRLVIFAGQPIDVTDEDALLLTFADLEPRRQAERALVASERHLLTVFEMAPVAMAITHHADGRLSRANAAFRQLTSYDTAAAIGRTIDDLGLWASTQERDQLIAMIGTEGRLQSQDVRLRRRDGEALDCLVSAEAIDVDGVACILWAYADITERRRTETELASAIDEVMKDASWLSRSILDKLATLRRPQTQAPASDLTPREREILDLICDDRDDAAISERLALSRNTVRNHVASIYAKTGVNRRSGAVVWGRERGMGSRRA
ncbi:helix-turn-helix transcriptional regulator [Sphingomonas mollis]|uniref:Helix-turn-helix transcriptional regulator n=1 Tax=Sphingomonas mollis TaxID=2795726 RepID=A0ABS0XUQ6_9SPHN|nr:helix-turn-helix transcriptional regulator [Sphingomonas sp. BT553]MBJ6123470.1 helix-turn-helix transcriptional regulator [Sphingomonas sp. BT553]